MDYKKLFQSTLSSVIKDKENFAKELLAQLKEENRSFDFVHNALKEAFFAELHGINSKSTYDLKKFQDLIFQSSSYYSVDALQNMLNNELQDLFNENYTNQSYSLLVRQLAKRIALRRAYLANEWNCELTEYLYYYGDFGNYTLQVYKQGISTTPIFMNYARRSEYKLRSPYGHIPEEKDVSSLEKKLNGGANSKTKEIRRDELLEEQNMLSNIPLFEEVEKLLLIHYLIRSKSLEKIEKVKILALLGNTPITTSIFSEASRDNIQYQQVLKGYRYLGKKNAKETLISLGNKVDIFKIDNLNRAIRMDLNEIRKEEIKKNLDKN